MSSAQAAFGEPSWQALSGTVLPGGYELAEILEADAQKARFRIRVLGDWSANAYLDAFSASGPKAQEQVILWLAAKELCHINLNSPLAAGQLEEQQAELIYVVATRPDDTLAGLLRDRAATVEEAREILTSLQSALAHLHGHGWVHGHLSPEQVLAVGDSIQISSEYAGQINARRPMDLMPAKYVAPEAADGNISPAAEFGAWVQPYLKPSPNMLFLPTGFPNSRRSRSHSPESSNGVLIRIHRRVASLRKSQH